MHPIFWEGKGKRKWLIQKLCKRFFYKDYQHKKNPPEKRGTFIIV